MFEIQPTYITVVIDFSDELTVLQEQLGRKEKERWSDSLLQRQDLQPLIPPIEVVTKEMRLAREEAERKAREEQEKRYR